MGSANERWRYIVTWSPIGWSHAQNDPSGKVITSHSFLLSVMPLQWRHNERDGVSNHQHHDYLLNCLFGHRSKKTSKLRVTGLCGRNTPVTGEFPHKGPVTRKMFPFDDVIMILPSIRWSTCFGFCLVWLLIIYSDQLTRCFGNHQSISTRFYLVHLICCFYLSFCRSLLSCTHIGHYVEGCTHLTCCYCIG